jgi:hypothetical protein
LPSTHARSILPAVDCRTTRRHSPYHCPSIAPRFPLAPAPAPPSKATGEAPSRSAQTHTTRSCNGAPSTLLLRSLGRVYRGPCATGASGASGHRGSAQSGGWGVVRGKVVLHRWRVAVVVVVVVLRTFTGGRGRCGAVVMGGRVCAGRWERERGEPGG